MKRETPFRRAFNFQSERPADTDLYLSWSDTRQGSHQVEGKLRTIKLLWNVLRLRKTVTELHVWDTQTVPVQSWNNIRGNDDSIR